MKAVKVTRDFYGEISVQMTHNFVNFNTYAVLH